MLHYVPHHREVEAWLHILLPWRVVSYTPTTLVLGKESSVRIWKDGSQSQLGCSGVENCKEHWVCNLVTFVQNWYIMKFYPYDYYLKLNSGNLWENTLLLVKFCHCFIVLINVMVWLIGLHPQYTEQFFPDTVALSLWLLFGKYWSLYRLSWKKECTLVQTLNEVLSTFHNVVS
jgi:hypothetical protein